MRSKAAMKKRVLFPIIIIALLLCLFPVFASAEDEEQKCGDDLYWALMNPPAP